MALSEETQRLYDISVKSTNGTATEEENTLYRNWLKQQVTEGKADYSKSTGMYTFYMDDEHNLSYSKDVYQGFINGSSLKQAVSSVRQQTAMTADECYKTIVNGTSNRTQLNKALEYYALHYDEVNAIDEQDNSLRTQKGDVTTIKDIVLADDYMISKLSSIAKEANTFSSNASKGAYGSTVRTNYSQNFVEDFSGKVDSDLAESSAEAAEKISKGLLGNGALNISDQDDFKLPDMGDYYLGNVDSTYLEAISKAYEEKKNAQAAANYVENTPEKTLGYYPDKDIYFLKAKVAFSDSDIRDGFIGGDFITVLASNLSSANDDSTDALNRFLQDLSSKTANYPMLASSSAGNMFEIKIGGITAPQPPRWAYEYNVPKTLLQRQEITEDIEYYLTHDYVVTYSWLGNTGSNRTSGNKSKDANCCFLYINDKWHAAEITKEDNNTCNFRWLLDPGYDNLLITEKNGTSTKVTGDLDQTDAHNKVVLEMHKLLKKCNNEIYIRFEGCGITPSTSFPAIMSNALINTVSSTQLQQMAEKSPSMVLSGLNRIHVQNCRRYFGEVYVKTSNYYGGTYINIAKYLLGDKSENTAIGISDIMVKEYVKSSEDYQGSHKSAFKLQQYDINSKIYADAFFETIDKLDDRKTIQKELFNNDWDDMLNWNVTIGDLTFFVPPVNIRLQTYTHSERMSLMRAKGSIGKTSQRMNRILSMDIFFNDDKAINGYPWTVTLNDKNKTPITYSINGLRALISMFKFTPFLPISNNFINRTLGIDAVVVTALDITSVPNYPKLIHATLTMAEFNWRTYMPDIVQLEAATMLGTAALQKTEMSQDQKQDQNEEDRIRAENENNESEEDKSEKTNVVTELVKNQKYRNWFEKTINWQTFRYYYQRPIVRGDYIDKLGYDFNSEEYIYLTCGSLTSFVPMHFQDPGIKFYMANENYLKEILKARYELLRKGSDSSQVSFSDSQLKALQAISSLNDNLQTLVANEKFQQDLAKLNDVVKKTAPVFSDAFDVIGNIRPDAYYNRGCITNPMTGNVAILEPLNTCLAQVDQITKDSRAKYYDYFDPDVEYMSIIDKDGKKVSFGIAIKMKQGSMTEDEYAAFKQNLTVCLGSNPFTEQGNWEGYIDELYGVNEDRIIIPISIDTEKDVTSLGFDQYRIKNNSLFNLDGNTAGMRLISTANSLYNKYKDKKSSTDTVPDVNALMNLVYDEYLVLDEDSPGFLVTNWHATLTNKVTQLHSLSNDGFAPQYLGGEDVVIHVNIQTQDKQVATMLTAIPKQISRLTRTYHLVMPCIPLRIESEFSKFLGVNEVTCEEAMISTEPGHPGLYNISMSFIAMDRTIREREAASRKAINNSGWNYYGDDSMSGYGKGILMANAVAAVGSVIGVIGQGLAGSLTLKALGATFAAGTGAAAVLTSAAVLAVGLYHVISDYKSLNSDNTTNDSAGSGVEQSKKYRQYFAMKDALAELDLYPDLELPSLAEMEAVGFYFTRYKFQDERLYVDPDFYFIYPVKLTSHIYRELAIHGMEAGIADTILTDATGACIKIQPNVGTGFIITEENDKYKQQVEQSENRREIAKELKTDQKLKSNENLKKKSSVEMPFLSLLNLTMERDSWAVCDTIHGMFLERKFLQEVRSYESVAFAATASNVNETRGTSNEQNTEAADSVEPAQEAVENQQSEVKEVVHTEGKFVYDELQPVVDAAGEFYTWLSNNTIEKMISGMDANAETFLNSRNFYTGTAVMGSIKTAVTAFLNVDEVNAFLTELKIDVDEKFTTAVCNIVCAAACAATGRKEFSGKKDSEDWKPEGNFGGVQLGTDQNAQSQNEVLWEQDRSKWPDYYEAIVKKGIEFGCFRFRMYTEKELQNLLYKDEGTVPAKPKETKYEDGNINNDHYVLDPGYRTANVATLEQYKGKCATSFTYATYAYMRLVFYWLVRLVYMRVLPNISTDILRTRAKLEISIQDTQATVLGKQNSEALVQGSGNKLVSLRKYIDFFSKDMYIIDAGKIWTAAVLTVSEGDSSIINAIETRNYDALNAVIDTCSTPSIKVQTLNNKGMLTIRKMTLALVGLGVINSIEAIGTTQTLPAVESDRDAMNKLFLNAAEDPTQFIPHSFHDMIVTDARGRMLRAFPTFYMTFVDEGREIGFWKLHDNFYNVNSISSIEVIKSRRLPTDVCTIVMSNFYNSFATEQEDYVRTPVATIEQAWNSIFSPSEYFKEQEVGRRNRPQEIRLRLRQGARIHVRMGYGNNAAMLPVMFNGVITEVSSEEVVKIIAQGDGVELLNPINIDKEAHNLPNEDDTAGYSVSNGATPLELSKAIFKVHGGPVKEALRKRFHLNLTPRNPFGIVHFGDPDFTTFCKDGECCQNLYEMTTKPIYSGNTNTDNMYYGWDDTVHITFDLFQKTPWDVLNICKSISPDQKLAVLPFGFRSTVFMGMPHFYYAYDYYKDENNVVKEKRKPFQQWHIYTSEQDIIGNGIVATNRDVKTVAIGLFQVYETFNSRSQQKVGPLYADWDIYTEAQKTMVVDTSLLGKGLPFVQGITNLVTTLGIGTFDSGGIDALFPDTGHFASHKKIAWRATANALKDSIMDMYAGDLIVFGDPSVKPQDRIFIADKYSGISGQTLVKETVHRISVDEGFTTTISPDCITIVNDNTELVKYEAMNRIGTVGAVSACLAEDLADSFSWTSTAGTVAAWAAVGAGAAKLTGFGLTKAGAQAAEWFANSNVGKAGLRGAQSALSWAGSKIGSNIVGNAATSLAAKIGTGLVLNTCPFLGQAASVAYFAAMTASVFIMPFINAWIESELKNYKVVTIFPLKKYGYAYTAGFEGARGTVYGSPTWGDRGSLGDVFDFLQGFPIIGAVGSLLASDEVKTLASKYIKDNNISSDGKETVSLDEEAGRIMSHIAGADDSSFANSYRSQMLQPRATTSNPVAMTNSYNYFKKLDTKNWKASLGVNRMISQDARIVPYIDDKFFVIVHETPGMSANGQSITEEVIDIGGKKFRVKAIHLVDGKGNAVIDVPLLNRQALNILYEILRRAKNYMPNANSTDPNENWELTKNDYIVLKSALRIGDRTSMGCTGFTFILEGTASNSQRALKAALENLDAEFKSYAGRDGIQTDIFKYKQQDNGEISIRVTMPQVSAPGETVSSDSSSESKSAENNSVKQTEEVESLHDSSAENT